MTLPPVSKQRVFIAILVGLVLTSLHTANANKARVLSNDVAQAAHTGEVAMSGRALKSLTGDVNLAVLSSHATVSFQHSRTRPFIFQMHIDKTGGSTIKTNPQAYFPGWVSCNQEFHVRTYSQPDRLKQMLSSPAMANTSCNFFTYEGHYDLGDLLQQKYHGGRGQVATVTFIRDPVQHWISKLVHEMRAGRSANASDFMAQIGSRYGRRQTAYIIREGETLALALARLHDLFFVGLTEFYDLSMCLLAHQLGDWVSKKYVLRMCACTHTIHPINVAPPALEHNTTLSLELVKQIVSSSSQDTYLYTHAAAIFWDRVEKMEQLTGQNLDCLKGLKRVHA